MRLVTATASVSELKTMAHHGASTDPDLRERGGPGKREHGGGVEGRSRPRVLDRVRSRVATLDDDPPPAPDIAAITELIAASTLESACGVGVKEKIFHFQIDNLRGAS